MQIKPTRNAPRLRGLIALNAALLLVLAAVTLGPAVNAQQRARGNYSMVGGGVSGATASVVYIADTVNEELIALLYDRTNKQLEGVGYRNLATDKASRMARRTGN